MATLTLVGNTNYSSLTLANNDSIDCAGYRLTIDAQPTATGVSVTSAGTAGTVVFSGAWSVPTWSFSAGTSAIIATLPAGATIGAATGGSANGAYGVAANYGTVTTATGGSSSAHGIANNYGTVTTATGGSVSGAYGVASNYGTVTTATGGSASNTSGVAINYGTVTTATGGSVSGAYGVTTNYGAITKFTDTTTSAVSVWYGDYKLISGPDCHGTISAYVYAPFTTIYSIGALAADCAVPARTTVIILSVGSGTPRNPFQSGVIG